MSPGARGALAARALLVLLVFLPGSAKGETARLRGQVVDSSGQPVPGVTVIVSGREHSFAGRETTNRRGRFTLKLRGGDGEYRIRLEKNGYEPVAERLDIESAEPAELTFVLRTEAEAVAKAAHREEENARELSARLYNEGAEAYNAGNETEALEHLGQAVALNPDLAPAHAALARIHLERQEWKEAAAAAERLGELTAGSGPLLLLYDALVGMGDRERSRRLRSEIVARYPGPQIAVRVFNEGVDAWQSGEHREAVELLSLALDLDSSLVDAHIGLANIREANGQLEEALEHVEAYLDANPDSLAVLEIRLRLLEELDRDVEAEELRSRLQQSDPQRALRSHFEEGVAHFHAGRVEMAVESFSLALAIDPDHARSRYQLGLCFASQGRNAAAIRELERFLELDPDAPDAASVQRMIRLLE